MNTIKSPPWLADVKQWLIDTSPFLDVDDTMPQIHHPNSLREVLFKSVMMCRLLYSAGLLISLASVLSSHSADAHVISSQDTLDDKETRNRDHESHETDAVFPIGKELDGWREPCRRVKKIRNYLRKKASEEAETRARWILMALVSKGSIS
ncbi:hypothetical protein HHK36_011633 [Tetracentron sinense]|uniref:Uncharacterized protein n=1 Tax=Tetracentron sinense TaxID=13715 RepID=A0A834Z9T3_TETSI|nr:hypothetical protein HHK36_011633 [Tetracentron sinense]